MKRIVFTWEFGGGLGHIQRILPLALKMQEKGHDVFCIMKHVIDTGRFFDNHNIKVLQAPVWQDRVKQLPTSYSYPETLFNLGYLVPGALLSMARIWQNLLDSIEPDLIVADHSPTALIATHGSSFPRALYGSGFFSPPRVNPMPSIVPWIKAPGGLLEYSDNKALQTVNNVLQELGSSPLQNFYELFDVDEDFLATFAELDHYQERGSAGYWGPPPSNAGGEVPCWPTKSNVKKIFCYIKPGYPYFEELLNGLQQSEASVVLFSPAIAEKIIEKYQTDRFFLHQEPVDMQKACQEADMVICHGGHGTVVNSLLHGKPLLLLPEHDQQIDQILTARNVLKLQAGLMFLTLEKKRNYKGLIQKILTEPLFTEQARSFAEKYKDFNRQLQLAKMADRCEELMGL